MKKSGVTQLNVRVPEFIAERLRILAALSGETQAELVLTALEAYLDQNDDHIRNFRALQQRFAGGRAHSAVKDAGALAQMAGQDAQAEEGQGAVPAEPAQTAKDSEQADKPVADSDSAEPAQMPQAVDNEQDAVPGSPDAAQSTCQKASQEREATGGRPAWAEQFAQAQARKEAQRAAIRETEKREAEELARQEQERKEKREAAWAAKIASDNARIFAKLEQQENERAELKEELNKQKAERLGIVTLS